MIRNYIKIAWRNLLKHKLFSFINIFGLASGMTVCILALTHIKGAYDYDTFHPAAHRTYRVITNLTRKSGEHFLAASSPLPLGTYLKDNFSQVQNCTRVSFSNEDVTANNKTLFAKQAYVDADFYKIFGFRLFTGSPATAPQTVVLTGETAKRFFGSVNPIGQIITLGKAGAFTVTGILAKGLHPSHIRFDLLAAMPLSSDKAPVENWADEAAAYTYVQLKAGVSKAGLQNILVNATGTANKSLRSSSDKTFAFEAQPLAAISPAMRPMYNILEEPAFPNLLAFALIGFFMLLLAFFNYVNLTLARSLDRAKEVGIRKVSGAVKQQLMMQFLSESLLIAFFAFGLAQVQLYFISTLQIVQNLTGTVSQDVRLWIFFILFTVVTGLLAGWIPARVLSSFKPVQVLKGKFNAQLFGGVGLRKTLTVIQFSASLIALITLLVFYQQSLYMAKADYGFNRERLLNIPVQAAAYSKAATALASVAGVEQVGGTSGLFGFSEGDNKFIKREKEADSLSATYFSVTPSFINNMELEFVAGENLPVTNAEKASPFIVLNEEACRRLKFKDSYAAVGKLIWVNDSTNYQVAGVVKDFHFASFLRSIAPLVLRHDPGAFRTLNIKVAAGAEPAIIPQLQTEWKKLYPNQLFESTWYDRQLYQQHLHKDDLLFIGLLTGMALSIACLGLLGMVIYTTKNRLKEVSIRKIMGASAGQIIFKISKEFLGLLGVAIGVGLPAGLFVSVQLLQQYAYRIPVGAEILAGSAAALLGLGVLTIGWHTYRAAIANPVKNLRTE